MQSPVVDERRLGHATVFLSVLFYVAFVGINFDPKVRVVQAKAFGDAPFGVPVTVVVIAVTTLLYLPVPWFLWHAGRVVVQAMMDGSIRSKLGVIVALFTIGQRHPHLRRSGHIAIGGLVYFVAIMAAWIVYAAVKGV